jgi:hypothetical protein
MHYSDDTTNLNASEHEEDKIQILNGQQRQEFFDDEGTSLFTPERRIDVLQRLVSLFK